jgi:hypothetical protein
LVARPTFYRPRWIDRDSPLRGRDVDEASVSKRTAILQDVSVFATTLMEMVQWAENLTFAASERIAALNGRRLAVEPWLVSGSRKSARIGCLRDPSTVITVVFALGSRWTV